MSEDSICPNIEDHTQQPQGYLAWHLWARKMAKAYKQRKCSGCGKYEIWEPRHALALSKGSDV